MKPKQTRLTILSQAKDLSKDATTGVSLHCHTKYSKEWLDFIPYQVKEVIRFLHFRKYNQENHQNFEIRNIDFAKSYFLPPLAEETVFENELTSIRKSGLEAIVSITDHDCIDANLNLCERFPDEQIPISMEWTVPFKEGFFHLGVHNLPKDEAKSISEAMLDFTYAKEQHFNFDENHLTELFTRISEFPEVLIVLNHPIWDIEMVGQTRHIELLKKFLHEYGEWIHALEINGFRSWSENQETIDLAETSGFPLVSGGDRHSCQPNTTINLTNSKTFADFAGEIRIDKRSEVVLFPEYSQPVAYRIIESFDEITRSQSDKQNWLDRLFFQEFDSDKPRPASELWKNNGPTWMRWSLAISRILANENCLPLFRLARSQKDVVPNQDRTPVLSTKSQKLPNLSTETSTEINGFAS